MNRDIFKILSLFLALFFIFTLFLVFSNINKEKVASVSGIYVSENTDAKEATGEYIKEIVKDANKEEIISIPATEPMSYAEYLRNIGEAFSKPTPIILAEDSPDEFDKITEKLKEYGNNAGEVIKNAALDRTPQVEIFDNFIKNPKNSAFLSKMRELAQIYKDIGVSLSKISAPEQISLAHDRLSNSYKEIGTAIVVFSDGLFNDEDTKQITDTYSDAIYKFPDAFLSVASTLRVYGVQFRESEAGSVFTLPI
ncbi:MAG: hypothetical protein ISR99_00405 [Parcubacteria group bacterium]|nr:hypothetical protein [Parcubacteria group bacterium]